MIICSSNQTVHAFYVKFNIVTPFPVSEQLLCCFAAFLADEGLSPQTTKSYLAAVQNMQISLGLPDPRDQSSLPILKRVLAGICRARLARRMPARVRLPITGPLLARICTALHSSSHPEKALIWVISSVAFFWFLSTGGAPGRVTGPISPSSQSRLGRCSRRQLIVPIHGKNSPEAIKV